MEKIQFGIRGVNATKTQRFLSTLPDECQPLNTEIMNSDGHALAMDPATITVIWDLLKVSLPAVLQTIGTVWAAKVAAANKTGGGPQQAVVELRTNKGHLRYALPATHKGESNKINIPLPDGLVVERIYLTWEDEKPKGKNA